MPGRGDIRVRWRLDLLALGAGPLVPPVALPMIPSTYKGRVRGGHSRCTELTRTMVAGAAAPLSVEELEITIARDNVGIRNTKSPDFREPLVTGPTLITGAVVRIRRNVVLNFL